MKLIEHKTLELPFIEKDLGEKHTSKFKACSTCKKIYPKTKKYFHTKSNGSDDGLNSQCKQCKHKANIKSIQKEKCFLRDMYNTTNTRARNKNIEFEFKNFEEFYQHWLNQKKIYGWYCPVTNEKMTTIRGLGSSKTTLTNISCDRRYPNEGYTKENVDFITWDINNRKHSMRPSDMKKYLTYLKKTRQA